MPAPITGRDIHSRGTSITAQQIIAIAPGAAQSCASRADKNAPTDDAAQTLDKLVENLEWDFGSGAWFLTTQCSADVRSALQAGSEAGWQRYITECVQTQVTDQRKEYWQKAVKALGVQSS
ncbi:hypothetical protein APSETT444_006648 [Aspergillus pseudonomiae]